MALKPNETVAWTLVVHKSWSLYAAATSHGLCYIGSLNKPLDELISWVGKHVPGSTLIRDDEAMKPYEAELIDYLEGKRTTFTVPSDMRGTPFQKAVWEALRQIPYGQTQSYSDIANQIEKPAAVRAVGSAIGANPVLITVPCHRVIGKNGALTGFRGGLEMKQELLQLEQRTSTAL
jgi:methylated-DNA-[protein]-cysteine S-methyltransferase